MLLGRETSSGIEGGVHSGGCTEGVTTAWMSGAPEITVVLVEGQLRSKVGTERRNTWGRRIHEDILSKSIRNSSVTVTDNTKAYNTSNQLNSGCNGILACGG